MKNKFLNKLIAIATVFIASTVIMPQKAEAAWINNYYGGWAYSNGDSLAVGWNKINGVWYYFNSNGLMQTGWISSEGKMYYLDKSGAMQTGIIQIEGKIYYLSSSGAMQTGSNVIGKKMYYFGPDGTCTGTDVPVPQKAYDYYGNPVQPYIPSQISIPNVEMDTIIPLDIGERAIKELRVHYKDDDGEELITKKVECDFGKSYAYITLYEPEKEGYEFIEWNTKKNGNGNSYDAGDKIKLTEDLKLYAQWSEIEEKEDEDDEKISVTGITISALGHSESVPTINVGDTIQLTRKITPSNATTTKIKWAVNNGKPGKAEITSTGKLTALEGGTVTVTATSTDGSDIVAKMTIRIES